MPTPPALPSASASTTTRATPPRAAGVANGYRPSALDQVAGQPLDGMEKAFLTAGLVGGGLLLWLLSR